MDELLDTALGVNDLPVLQPSVGMMERLQRLEAAVAKQKPRGTTKPRVSSPISKKEYRKSLAIARIVEEKKAKKRVRAVSVPKQRRRVAGRRAWLDASFGEEVRDSLTQRSQSVPRTRLHTPESSFGDAQVLDPDELRLGQTWKELDGGGRDGGGSMGKVEGEEMVVERERGWNGDEEEEGMDRLGVTYDSVHPLARWAYRRAVQDIAGRVARSIPPPPPPPIPPRAPAASTRKTDAQVDATCKRVIAAVFAEGLDPLPSILPPWLAVKSVLHNPSPSPPPPPPTTKQFEVIGTLSPHSGGEESVTVRKRKRGNRAASTSPLKAPQHNGPSWTASSPPISPQSHSPSWSVTSKGGKMTMPGVTISPSSVTSSSAGRKASLRVAALAKDKDEPAHWTTWRRMHATSLAEEVAAASRRRAVAAEEALRMEDSKYIAGFDFVRDEMEEWWRKEEDGRRRREEKLAMEDALRAKIELEEMRAEEERCREVENGKIGLLARHEEARRVVEGMEMAREDEWAKTLRTVEKSMEGSERRIMALEDGIATSIRRIEGAERERREREWKEMCREDFIGTQRRFDEYTDQLLAFAECRSMEVEDGLSSQFELIQRGYRGLRRLIRRRRFWNSYYAEQFAALSIQKSWRAARISKVFIRLVRNEKHRSAAIGIQAIWRGHRVRCRRYLARAHSMKRISRAMSSWKMQDRLRRISNAVIFVRNVVRMQRNWRRRARGLERRLREMLSFPPTMSAKDMFEELDINSDGKLTAAEFVQGGMAKGRRLEGDGDGEGRRGRVVEPPSFSKMMTLFQAIDTKSHGYVSLDEFEAAMKASPEVFSRKWADSSGRRVSGAVAALSPLDRREANQRVLDFALKSAPSSHSLAATSKSKSKSKKPHKTRKKRIRR